MGNIDFLSLKVVMSNQNSDITGLIPDFGNRNIILK